MSLSSAKAKLDAQGGDPVTGYISKADHQESYDELVDDTALTGSTTAEALDVTGALTAGTIASDATVAGTGLAGGLLSSANPVINGVAAPGTSAIPSRDDHVHASDTTKVTGPASATDNALVRFDGTGGKTVQNSGITVDDSGNVTSDVVLSKANPVISAAATSGNAEVRIQGAAATLRFFRFRTGTSRRWLVGAIDDPESGSNVGSTFQVWRYSDADAYAGTPISIARATGKITFGDIGATAGLELGSSGPRVMSGTGSPEGVVTAPVGSTWIDTAATTGAIKWIKASGTGNTGWKVEYGDTGTRDLTTYWAPADITVNSLSMRRVNETIYLQMDVTLVTAYGTNTIGTSWPSGFTPAASLSTAVDDLAVDTNGVTTAILLWRSNLLGIYRSPAPSSGSRWRVFKTWRTTDAWPTSLPGSAA